VDVVSGGEQGKVGYSSYVAHCLTGFEGKRRSFPRVDWPATRALTI
jgi:hypothetical protein